MCSEYIEPYLNNSLPLGQFTLRNIAFILVMLVAGVEFLSFPLSQCVLSVLYKHNQKILSVIPQLSSQVAVIFWMKIFVSKISFSDSQPLFRLEIEHELWTFWRILTGQASEHFFFSSCRDSWVLLCKFKKWNKNCYNNY